MIITNGAPKIIWSVPGLGDLLKRDVQYTVCFGWPTKTNKLKNYILISKTIK